MNKLFNYLFSFFFLLSLCFFSSCETEEKLQEDYTIDDTTTDDTDSSDEDDEDIPNSFSYDGSNYTLTDAEETYNYNGSTNSYRRIKLNSNSDDTYVEFEFVYNSSYEKNIPDGTYDFSSSEQNGTLRSYNTEIKIDGLTYNWSYISYGYVSVERSYDADLLNYVYSFTFEFNLTDGNVVEGNFTGIIDDEPIYSFSYDGSNYGLTDAEETYYYSGLTTSYRDIKLNSNLDNTYIQFRFLYDSNNGKYIPNGTYNLSWSYSHGTLGDENAEIRINGVSYYWLEIYTISSGYVTVQSSYDADLQDNVYSFDFYFYLSDGNTVTGDFTGIIE